MGGGKKDREEEWISIEIQSLLEGSFQIYLKITAKGLKFYSTTAVSLMFYDLECWLVKKSVCSKNEISAICSKYQPEFIIYT